MGLFIGVFLKSVGDWLRVIIARNLATLHSILDRESFVEDRKSLLGQFPLNICLYGIAFYPFGVEGSTRDCSQFGDFSVVIKKIGQIGLKAVPLGLIATSP